MHIALYTHGGVDYNLAAPHTMIYVLESLSNDSDDSRHVSQAFRIFQARLAHKDEHPCFSSHWEASWIAKHENTLAIRRSTDPILAGAFPVTFLVQGAGGVTYHFLDAYRPLRHPVDVSPELNFPRVFPDLDLLCQRAIDLGIVFERPSDPDQIYPEAAMYARSGRKGWKKIPMPNIWEDVLEPMMDQHPSEFLSGVPFELIWALFKKW